MQLIPKTVTPRQLQRSYRKIFDTVKETNEPVVVINNNKPDVAIVPIEHVSEPYNAQASTAGTMILKDAAGMWEGRVDWNDKKTNDIVREMRSKRIKRIYDKQD